MICLRAFGGAAPPAFGATAKAGQIAEDNRAYDHAINTFDVYFGRNSFPGYCWLFPTGKGEANVGLGMALDTALSNLYWDQAGLVLFVIFAVVIVTEVATAWVRSRII